MMVIENLENRAAKETGSLFC